MRPSGARGFLLPTLCVPSDGSHAWVSTVVTPRWRMQVDASAAGVPETLHVHTPKAFLEKEPQPEACALISCKVPPSGQLTGQSPAHMHTQRNQVCA